jgi:crotonobetainyl-CoA:carnitine CoA-transferase CaiB-like acyl-CoA transferase
VLVSNLAPGSTARLGISPDQLRDRHLEVIAVEIDGYGYGAADRCRTSARTTFWRNRSPARARSPAIRASRPNRDPPIADISTGLYSALSIMALLYSGTTARARGAVNVSLFDTMMDLMGYPLTYTQHSGVDQQPLGMSSPAVAPYGAYRTADGQTVVLGTTNDRGSGWPARSSNARTSPTTAVRHQLRPVANRAVLDEAISWCGRHDLAEVQKVADAAGIGNARTTCRAGARASAVEQPRPLANGADRGGPIRAILPPPIIDGYEQPMGRSRPR